ncbi:MAG: hypothetical protein JWL66_695 [Sphingomonadales bacterium]|nr:hypothetical protein [Sphingomonadales bacterium]
MTDKSLLVAAIVRDHGVDVGTGWQPQLRKVHPDRWTVKKQKLFLTRLAETGRVPASLAETGMCLSGLYKLRKRSAGFCAAWDVALELGYVQVEAMLLDRALNGRRRVVREGQIVDEFVECSDSLALRLIAQHRKRTGENRMAATGSKDNPERLRERFMTKLKRLARAAGWEE